LILTKLINNKFLWYGLAALIAAIYFCALYCLSLNIPIGDDFPAFVDIAPQAIDRSISLKTFLRQINEHRILYNRIWWITGIWIFNSIDFQILLFIGNFSLVFLVVFFLKIQRKYELPSAMVAVFSLLFFSWVGYSNSLCSMMALQNFTFPLLVIVGLWFMIENKQPIKIFLGLGLLTLAFYTTGLGFVAMLFGLVYLFIQKKYKTFWISLAISTFFIGLYFAFYEASSVQSSIFTGISQPLELLKRYLAFLGGVLPISKISPLPECLLGLIVLSMFISAIIRLKSQTPHGLFFIILFFFFLAAVVVLARFELNEYIANRFKIGSIVLFASISVLFIMSFKSNKTQMYLVVGLLFFTGVLNLFSYKSYYDYRLWVDEFAVDLLNVKLNKETIAYQPKGWKYIRNNYYQKDFSEIYKGLYAEYSELPKLPITLSKAELHDYSIHTQSIQNIKEFDRPVVVVLNEDLKPLGFLPIHVGQMICKDPHEIIESNPTSKAYLIDLRLN
jgi:hypothetical protein